MWLCETLAASAAARTYPSIAEEAGGWLADPETWLRAAGEILGKVADRERLQAAIHTVEQDSRFSGEILTTVALAKHLPNVLGRSSAVSRRRESYAPAAANGELNVATEAVIAAIRRFGRRRGKDAIAELERIAPLAATLAGAVGWARLCESDEFGVRRLLHTAHQNTAKGPESA